MTEGHVLEPARETQVLSETDVLVVGGGTAGILAALAAARNGARTVLVESEAYLGGVTATGLGMTINNAAPGGVEHGGFTSEFLRAVSLRETEDPGPMRRRFWQDPELLKTKAFEMLQAAKVQILLRSVAAAALTEGQRASGAIFESKGGRFAIRSKALVDCTGDADVAAFAGAAFWVDDKFHMQATNINFILADVDRARADAVLSDQPAWKNLVERARAAGMLASVPPAARIGWYTGEPLRPNTALFNCVRVPNLDWLAIGDLTQGEYLARKQMCEIAEFLRQQVPGFENSYIQQSSPHNQIRESRRIVGMYTMTEDDCMSLRRFPDGVVRCDNLVDDVLPGGAAVPKTPLPPGAWYHIPFRTMVPVEVDGLLVAGRCISSTHRAQAAIRPMSQCMAMGEVAGTAAALAVAAGVEPRNLPFDRLLARLVEQGMRPNI